MKLVDFTQVEYIFIVSGKTDMRRQIDGLHLRIYLDYLLTYLPKKNTFGGLFAMESKGAGGTSLDIQSIIPFGQFSL
ncbi:transposase [Alkalibacterium kapii]|uniref:Uncharacterized protein n=1 Tax=Alkalibacterium kapii TaxID=426704 RepID=A0A511ATD5_9LACT|nr:transposase [Alkalibacterium kapii]GEK90982.1 hypothetical protein AKA01nite_06040 [Alkalibacterium kapii]